LRPVGARYTEGMFWNRLTVMLPLFAAVLAAQNARADSLIFARGGALYNVDAGGASPARRLSTAGDTPPALWSAAPDGRRIAYLLRAGSAGADANGLAARPATVYVSDLSGRHRKRLFSTDALHDRQGDTISALGVGEASAKFDDYEPLSLAWSADSRTLYISCVTFAGDGAKSTFAVDAASGIALVDAQGRWKSLAAVSAIDARGGRMVGAGFAPVGSPPIVAAERNGPLYMINLADGTKSPVVVAPGGGGPELNAVADPALSPNEREVAFATADGLWALDRTTRTVRKLVDGVVLRPRWSGDGNSLFFLLRRPGSEASPQFDLYAVDAPADLSQPLLPSPLRAVLQSVDWFDIVPE
jgi:hypothetical protein